MNLDSSSPDQSGDQTLISKSKRNAGDETGLFGVWSPCITPVDENYCIDFPRLCTLIKWLLANGCHGVSVFGTTGESASFSVNERISALEQIVAAGISPSRLMVGNGFTAITDIVEVTRHAVEMGCNKVLMLPPFYFKDPSVEGLANSYRYVLDNVNSSSLKVVLYHFPRMSTIPITSSLIDQLVRSHGSVIAGLKDSTGDWQSAKNFIQNHPQLAIFPGIETLLLKGLKIGGVGTITATANVNAAGIRQVYDLWSKGESAGAKQQESEVIRTIIFEYPLAAALKFLHAHFRSDPAWEGVRPPLTTLSTSSKKSLIESLEKVGFSMDVSK